MNTPVVLVPRDGVFFKDGRGWATSTMGRAGAFDWPFPPTVLGALRAVWGYMAEDARGGAPFSKDEWVEKTRNVHLGLTLPLRRALKDAQAWNKGHRMWPIPADALFLEQAAVVHRLLPRGLPKGVRSLGLGDDAALESLAWCTPDTDSKAKPLTPPRWWTNGTFIDWLFERPVSTPVSPDNWPKSPPRRTDVRLAIDGSTMTARESALYSLDIVEPVVDGYQWSIGAQLELPAAPPRAFDDELLVLGGNSRVGVVETPDEAVFAPPDAKDLPASASGIRVVCASPAHFDAGWLPDGLVCVESSRGTSAYQGMLPGLPGELLTLHAALVPRATHWSGWSMEHKGPRPTLRLVPAGAVYFFRKASGADFTAEEIRRLWLSAWGKSIDMGMGRIVAGPWTQSQPA